MIKSNLSKIKDLFRSRKIAYVQTFPKGGPFSTIVLKDLAKFCRAHDSTYHKDQRTSDVLEGRREVWLRIQSYLSLSLDELYDLHHIKDKEG